MEAHVLVGEHRHQPNRLRDPDVVQDVDSGWLRDIEAEKLRVAGVRSFVVVGGGDNLK
jgi:hypothetical protein